MKYEFISEDDWKLFVDLKTWRISRYIKILFHTNHIEKIYYT